MALIDKDALIAEIKRLIRANELYLSESYTDEIRFQKVGAYSALNDLLHFLDTLEVNEVDIEKKKMEWIEQLCKYFKANYLYVRGHESFISNFRMYAKNLK